MKDGEPGHPDVCAVWWSCSFPLQVWGKNLGIIHVYFLFPFVLLLTKQNITIPSCWDAFCISVMIFFWKAVEGPHGVFGANLTILQVWDFLLQENAKHPKQRCFTTELGGFGFQQLNFNCWRVDGRKLQALLLSFIKNKWFRQTSHITTLIILFWLPNTEASSDWHFPIT